MTSESRKVVCMAKPPGEQVDFAGYFTARSRLNDVQNNHDQPRSIKKESVDANRTSGFQKTAERNTAIKAFLEILKELPPKP